MDQETDHRGSRRYWVWLLIAAVAVAALLYLLSWQFPGVLSDGNEQPYIAHHTILLVVLVSALLAGRRERAGTVLRHAAIWIAIGAGLVLAYSYRADFRDMRDRIVGELRPDKALVGATGDITIRRGSDGHFRLTATVDGKSIRFLVDTGATMIALSPADARSIGFDPARLSYSLPTRTANGTAFAAPVILDEVRVGPVRARNLKASVSRGGLDQSLLGMNFLDRLSGYEVRGDAMILRP